MPNVEPLREGDPATVGPYRLVGRLGAGGHGVVYLGQARNGTPVAVKALREGLAGDDRLARDIAAARKVQPFCLAQVLDASTGGRPYIVSEYVDGPSLQQAGRQGGADLQRLAVSTATALDAIHQAGVVHGDFKPSNVLLGPDGPQVVDFGLAAALGIGVQASGAFVGTPAYMAPEQLAGRPVGPPADVFAWASVMVFAATGVPPFGDDSLPAVINRVLNDEPQLGELRGLVREIMLGCLSKEPQDRPAMRDVLLRLTAPSRRQAAPPQTGSPHMGADHGQSAHPSGARPSGAYRTTDQAQGAYQTMDQAQGAHPGTDQGHGAYLGSGQGQEPYPGADRAHEGYPGMDQAQGAYPTVDQPPAQQQTVDQPPTAWQQTLDPGLDQDTPPRRVRAQAASPEQPPPLPRRRGPHQSQGRPDPAAVHHEQDSPQPYGREPIPSHVQDPAAHHGHEPPAYHGQESQARYGQDSAAHHDPEPPAQEPSRHHGQEPGGNFGQEPGGRFGQEPAGHYGHQPGERFGQEPGGRFGQEPGGRFGEEGGPQQGLGSAAFPLGAPVAAPVPAEFGLSESPERAAAAEPAQGEPAAPGPAMAQHSALVDILVPGDAPPQDGAPATAPAPPRRSGRRMKTVVIAGVSGVSVLVLAGAIMWLTPTTPTPKATNVAVVTSAPTTSAPATPTHRPRRTRTPGPSSQTDGTPSSVPTGGASTKPAVDGRLQLVYVRAGGTRNGDCWSGGEVTLEALVQRTGRPLTFRYAWYIDRVVVGRASSEVPQNGQRYLAAPRNLRSTGGVHRVTFRITSPIAAQRTISVTMCENGTY
ncbi:protein kinase [Nonomuraea phyllanthi]|uniref:non-specific serine/threonine protein kinase n=1 Tax=Nonomuraea phyllanthi TaxID=2219224 RepID=A0A5C4VUC1_9ACTN|nr:protein kinase [Nonomuraea phyllanthi]KAB8190057.1 protein kinase [Nonomuraea phyllanthi]